MFTELCCCCTCNGHCNIFNRHRFQVLSGLLHIPNQPLTDYQHFLHDVPDNYCSLGRMKHKLKTMFHMVMASSILSLPREQCTSQCYWLVGTPIMPWESKFSYYFFGPLNGCANKNILFLMLINPMTNTNWDATKPFPLNHYTIKLTFMWFP